MLRLNKSVPFWRFLLVAFGRICPLLVVGGGVSAK